MASSPFVHRVTKHFTATCIGRMQPVARMMHATRCPFAGVQHKFTRMMQAVVDLVAQQAAAKMQTGRPGSMSQKAAGQAEAAVPTRQPALRLGLAWQVRKPFHH